MSNDECVLYVESNRGSRVRFFKDGKQWVQVSTRGREFPMTAEQVLSHVLPCLVPGAERRLKIWVERR